MIDFTEALYLGFDHPTEALIPWRQLTTGKPAVLEVAQMMEQQLTRSIASLLGCQQAVLASSTLHLFFDLCGLLIHQRFAIFIDEAAYPIAWWGMERAALRGMTVRSFRHLSVASLHGILIKHLAAGQKPVVITDGFCPGCGCAAPLLDLAQLCRSWNGWLIIDDTQVFGLLGIRSNLSQPFGLGGGGSLRFHGLSGRHIVVISSLAKSFGVPMAVLGGAYELVQQFKNSAPSRMHCSPLSRADLSAGIHALELNRTQGDQRRSRLMHLIQRFQSTLRRDGIEYINTLFPVQTILLPLYLDPHAVFTQLEQLGIFALLRQGHNSSGIKLSFIITVKHTMSMIDYTTEQLQHIIHPVRHRSVMIESLITT